MSEHITLTDDEREALWAGLRRMRVEDGAPVSVLREGDKDHALWAVSPAVERIVAARVTEVEREPSALAEQYNAEVVRRLSAEAKVRAAEALAEEWEQTPETVKCYGLDRAHGSRLRAVLNRGGDR